jgi:hypothetical protein
MDNEEGLGPLGDVAPWGGDIIIVYAEKKLKEKQILSKDQNFRLIILGI